ncbi:MAG: preprotein translocase subunit SecE [Thermogutta sp.]
MAQAAGTKNTTVWGRVFAELFRAGLYKRNQGRVVRQGSFAAIVAFSLFGVWRLHGALGSWGFGTSWQIGVPALILALTVWLAYRLMNFPEVADFLIAVEAEMRKVTWPSRSELIRSCVVVLVTMFTLAFCLTVYDFVWASFLRWTGIL